MIRGATRLLCVLRVNPARAGMIPFALATLYPNYCKPRASGDDPCLADECWVACV